MKFTLKSPTSIAGLIVIGFALAQVVEGIIHNNLNWTAVGSQVSIGVGFICAEDAKKGTTNV